MRISKGAHDLQHLLTKAAERLRRGDYYCRRWGAHIDRIKTRYGRGAIGFGLLPPTVREYAT